MTTAETTLVVLTGGRLAYTLDQLADATPFSQSTWRRAIAKAKDDGIFPRPLPAHRDSKGRAVVLATDAQSWLEDLPPY
jgi:hypothetical protein